MKHFKIQIKSLPSKIKKVNYHDWLFSLLIPFQIVTREWKKSEFNYWVSNLLWHRIQINDKLQSRLYVKNTRRMILLTHIYTYTPTAWAYYP